MRRTNVYVDGFNFYYGCVKGTPYKWLDFSKLFALLLPPGKNSINRIRYFTALVHPRPDDPQEPQRQQIFLRALRTIPNLSIHCGTFISTKIVYLKYGLLAGLLALYNTAICCFACPIREGVERILERGLRLSLCIGVKFLRDREGREGILDSPIQPIASA